MQIQTGTCDVTNGSSNVIASEGNDWSDAGPNSLFSIPGPGSVLYTVATVEAPGESASGRWELFLTANFAGTTAAGAAYQITKDFTPGLGIALIVRGDTDTALIVNRNLLLLEASVSSSGATAPPFLGSFTDYTGGTVDDVDSVPTLGKTRDILYCFDHATEGVKFLKLKSGTDAPAPGKFRGTDYNASTNACFWEIR